jgi:uncharacterized RDD family membrane protein YckC
MDYGRPPGDELDPQAVPTGPAPAAYSPPPSDPRQYPQVMAPQYYVPGVISTEAGLLAPAGFAPRFVAFLIDAAVLGILVQIFTLLAGVPQPDEQQIMQALQGFMRNFDISVLEKIGPPPWVGILTYLVYGAYFTLFHAYNGASLGKMALGLQVRRADGGPLSLGLAAARYLLYWLAAKLLYTAWMIPLDREKRTAYDALLKLNVYKALK